MSDSPKVNAAAGRQAEEDRVRREPGLRLILWLFGVVLAAVLLGSLLAPPVFNLAVRLGRHVAPLEFLRETDFERVFSRMIMISALGLSAATWKWSGLRGVRDIGFLRDRSWWKSLARGFLLGAGSIALLLILGRALGAYQPGSLAGTRLLRLLPTYLAGALLVGVIEEGFFRGAFFGAFRRVYGFWTAASITSLLFSLAHFARPRLPYGVVYGYPDAGLRMLPHLFNTLDYSPASYPFCVTLFLMGMALCVLYRRTGSIYFIAGLHAGWVWMMRVGMAVFKDGVFGSWWLFGNEILLSKSNAALIAMGLFLVGALWWPRAALPKPRDPYPA